MIPKQVEQVLNRYSRLLLEAGASPNRHLTAATLPAKASALSHALWMCEQARHHLDTGSWDKAMRWLGFIQGVLWCFGVASIDEMKEDNR